MDYDIDMEDASGQYQEAPQEAPVEDLLDIQEPGEIEEPKLDDINLSSTTVVPYKVHIRGLDALTPDDIKAYITEHAGSGTKRPGSVPYDRIEWIDDTSANLVFSSDDAAAAALAALADVPTEISDTANLPVGELIKAKTYTAKAEDVSAGLYVRFAVESDKKQVGAAARSRFYLLHPEYDPEERRRNRRRHDYRDSRDGRDRRDGRGRDYRDRRNDVQDDREADIRNNAFDVNLYDDDGPSLARRRRSYSRSRSRSRSRSPRRANRDKELFAIDTFESKELFPAGDRDLFDSTKFARRDYRDRDGDRNGRNDRDRNRNDKYRERDSGRLRDRSLSPPSGLYSFDEDDYDGRLADERAEAVAAAAARNRDKARAIRDILTSGDNVVDHDSADNAAKELFSDNAKQGKDLFADDSRASVSASLSDRITRPSDAADKGFNIRGIAKGKGDLGISIKGIASARELFPSKLDGGSNQNGNSNGSKGRGRNGGKDGADNSLASRITRPRQRAEDLFR